MHCVTGQLVACLMTVLLQIMIPGSMVQACGTHSCRRCAARQKCGRSKGLAAQGASEDGRVLQLAGAQCLAFIHL